MTFIQALEVGLVFHFDQGTKVNSLEDIGAYEDGQEPKNVLGGGIAQMCPGQWTDLYISLVYCIKSEKGALAKTIKSLTAMVGTKQARSSQY